MKTTLVRTDQIYHRIIDAPDAETRHRLYLELLVEPWQHMMNAVAGGFGADASDDPLAGARAWNWLLPADLTAVPASLAALEAADAWTVAAQALADGAACFDCYADRLPLDVVEGWLVLGNPATSDPVMRGYTGGVDFFGPRLIGQFDDPNDDNLPKIAGLVVHEMHHLIRLRLFPWDMLNTTVADYIVHEGLAESFAASRFGEGSVTFFAAEISGDDLALARRVMGEGLARTGFDVLRSYIFGDYWAEKQGRQPVGMPTYGGYAVGYRTVQAFLERTGTSIEDATFLPADQIVAESGYFEM